ncbi:UMP-CMP kinase 2 [Clonorchis sinensis]|uniref:UMP-CMP kinase 2 n=2 Tax=Clonorchis sinensis TaxID=79923 RepID=A0A8T1N3I6_CLOSI|nr:UMP-CMP kinase 2 [Clonorchis sinensis]
MVAPLLTRCLRPSSSSTSWRFRHLSAPTFCYPFSMHSGVKFNVCFILGGPGAGKGTICQKIVEDHNFIHLSAGELLRRACNTPDSAFGAEIQRHMKNGSIVPAKITCGLLDQAMKQGYEESKCMNYLVDGFPRNEDNRTCWEVEMGSKTVLRQVIVADCTDDICIERCLGRDSGRIDDNEETLKRRLRQFKEQCLPIIEYYEARNLVSRIDATKSKEEVYKQVNHLMASLGY